MSRKTKEEETLSTLLKVTGGILLILIGIVLLILKKKYNIELFQHWLVSYKTRRWFSNPWNFIVAGTILFLLGIIPKKKEKSKLTYVLSEPIKDDKQKVDNYYFEENGNLHINDKVFRVNLMSEIYTVNNVVQFNYANQPILLYLDNEKDAIKLWKEIRKHK